MNTLFLEVRVLLCSMQFDRCTIHFLSSCVPIIPSDELSYHLLVSTDSLLFGCGCLHLFLLPLPVGLLSLGRLLGISLATGLRQWSKCLRDSPTKTFSDLVLPAMAVPVAHAGERRKKMAVKNTLTARAVQNRYDTYLPSPLPGVF